MRLLNGLPVDLSPAEQRQLRDGSVSGSELPDRDEGMEPQPAIYYPEGQEGAFEEQGELYVKALTAAHFFAAHGIMVAAVEMDPVEEVLPALTAPEHAGALVAHQELVHL